MSTQVHNYVAFALVLFTSMKGVTPCTHAEIVIHHLFIHTDKALPDPSLLQAELYQLSHPFLIGGML